LILVPLLVLAVVLLLAFAGCTFTHGSLAESLTFTAKVPIGLTVVSPGGVTFRWQTPSGTGMETATVPSPTSAALVKAYVDAALALGPSLFWTLGSVDGLTESSSLGRDGVPLGGVTVGSEQDGPTDFSDAAATLFDGTDDGIGSAYNPFVGTAARTFVGWARWDAGGAQEYTLFGSSAGDADRPTLRVVISNRNVRWLPSGSDGQVITWDAAAAPAGTWFMWALLADPGNDRASLFINGTKVSEQPMTDDWPAAPGNFQAAIGATNKQPFKGAQGLVAVYERGLADAEVVALAHVGDNVYEHELSNPEVGLGWLAGCAMTVRADSQDAGGDSGDFSFMVEASKSYVLSFQAAGSPLTPADPFRITWPPVLIPE
jgi:Concanavalin A-like lectin/glucanases superfamily